MFNNIVLDVAIGLIFIYLLYSLLATTVNEFVAMVFAYRHRMLEKGIEQMLDGKNFSYYWWDKVVNLIRWFLSFIKIKNKFKSNFLPEKELSRKKFMSNEKINDTGVQALIKPPTYIKRAKLNKKATLFAASIINHPLYRRRSEQSILYKKPAYLEATAFSDILTDLLSGKKSAIDSSPVLMNDIRKFVSNELENNPDLKSILNLYIEQANGDVQKFKFLLENWYDETMERVSGWYKRQTTKVLFIIGLVLAFTFNISTIDIVKQLSVNKDLRETIAQSASNYVKQRSEIGKGKDSADKVKLDSDAKEQLNDIQRLYKDSIASVNSIMGFGWDSSIVHKNVINGKVQASALNGFNRWLQSWLYTPAFNGYYSGISILSEAFSHPVQIIGFIITALAICLGAPFWFDLLNKFVNIRAGGNDPAEKKGKASASKTVMLNQKPKLNSFA